MHGRRFISAVKQMTEIPEGLEVEGFSLLARGSSI